MTKFQRFILPLGMLALAALPCRGQIVNPSFEASIGVPTGWTAISGINVVFASAPDAGFPTNGTRWLQVRTATTGPAIPHNNPGGIGTDAVNAAGIKQSFFVPAANMTRIDFDCLFMSPDDDNDFLEASLSDGFSVLNLVHLDLSNLGGGPVSSTGWPTTPVTHVSVDFGAFFPTATPSNTFTLKLWCGNRNNNTVESRAYFDNILLTPGTPLQQNTFDINDLGFAQQLAIHTTQPFREFWALYSDETSGALGSGPALGLQLSPLLFLCLQQPLGTIGIHDTTNATGDYFVNIPTFVNPPGLTFDRVLVTLSGGVVLGYTGAQRYVWP